MITLGHQGSEINVTTPCNSNLATSGCNIDTTTLVAQSYHLHVFSMGCWTRVIKVTCDNTLVTLITLVQQPIENACK